MSPAAVLIYHAQTKTLHIIGIIVSFSKFVTFFLDIPHFLHVCPPIYKNIIDKNNNKSVKKYLFVYKWFMTYTLSVKRICYRRCLVGSNLY